ncbi:hypothetical protein LB553_21305 [Mesorhizobium sp. CA8]|uniref:hypothetical protein n=1 Tax=Mesorhizobium sp. CA8 TaxID=2876637 RepID=UPI001CCE2AF1|nr:hypothetical protein [Mesorhizobium sp. CA8]MBZ9763399.1 hypothetical protein [Mesorhizobium sp. CA8]
MTADQAKVGEAESEASLVPAIFAIAGPRSARLAVDAALAKKQFQETAQQFLSGIANT